MCVCILKNVIFSGGKFSCDIYILLFFRVCEFKHKIIKAKIKISDFVVDIGKFKIKEFDFMVFLFHAGTEFIFYKKMFFVYTMHFWLKNLPPLVSSLVTGACVGNGDYCCWDGFGGSQ